MHKNVDLADRIWALVIATLTVPGFAFMIPSLPQNKDYLLACVFIIVAIIGISVSAFWKTNVLVDFGIILGSTALAGAFALFIKGSIYDIVDFIFKINFWGNAQKIPLEAGFSAMLLCSTVVSVVKGYIQ